MTLGVLEWGYLECVLFASSYNDFAVPLCSVVVLGGGGGGGGELVKP